MSPRVYRFYIDPRHGWLAVPKADVHELGIFHLISECSYEGENNYYLEEDSDAGVFIDASGIDPGSIDFVHADESSPIRNLPSIDNPDYVSPWRHDREV